MRRQLPSRGLLATAALAACALGWTASADASPAHITRAERERIVELVRSDPRIVAALGGATVSVEAVGPWSHDGTRETLIGGGVTLAFDSPRSVEADWPLLDYEDDGAYTVTTVHYRVENADAIMAWVDLGKQQVVSFDTRDGEADQSSVRHVEPARASDSSRTGPGRNGSASAAFIAAFLLAAVVAVLVAAASRVGSGWPA